MPATATPAPVLADGAVYLGDNGRAMCVSPRCAGGTARFTGRDLSGQKLARVGVADVAEWASYGLGPMSCECGAVSLTALAGPDGWPLPRTETQIRDAYVEVVRALGPGFHPDTRGDDYVNLPEGVTAIDVDAAVRLAVAAGIDVYDVACDVLLPS